SCFVILFEAGWGSTLINRKGVVVELQNREVNSGRINITHVALVPKHSIAVFGGFVHQSRIKLIAILDPVVTPFAVHDLGVVVMGIVPVTKILSVQVAEILR